MPAVARAKAHNDSQLELFAFSLPRLPNHEIPDAIRPDGREALGEHLPKMVAELEAKGQLHAMLLEAEEKTEAELDSLRRHFIQQGLTPRQAQDRAWEIVRERYIYLPPEQD